MNLNEWASFDLRNIPTDVLKSAYGSMHKELCKRRDLDKVSNKKVLTINGEEYRKIRNPTYTHSSYRFQDLEVILAEDWSAHFPVRESEKKYYVYAHVMPAKTKAASACRPLLGFKGIPFYIGKGTGNRAWELNRNEGHGKELKALLNAGVNQSEIVSVIREGLSENEALQLESKLIYFFGTRFEPGRKGLLVNLDIPRSPHRAR